jgi:hypothetical protein
VFLNTKEDRSLWELTQAAEIPQKVKERVQVLRLSSRGWKVEKIAVYMKWSKTTALLNPSMNHAIASRNAGA